MGSTIWVDVEGRPEDDLPPDSSIMLKLMDELDDLSGRLKVAKLSEFVDYGVMEAEFADELGLESSSDDEPGGTWFDPGRPLEAVRAIHERLAGDFTALRWVPDRSRDHWPGQLMEELQHCRTVLEEALARGRKVRLLMMP